jgi:hypothetical protein
LIVIREKRNLMNLSSLNYLFDNSQNLFYCLNKKHQFEPGPLGWELLSFLPENDWLQHIQSLKNHISPSTIEKIQEMALQRLGRQSQQFCQKIEMSPLYFSANLQNMQAILKEKKEPNLQHLNLAFALGEWEWLNQIWEKHEDKFSENIDIDTLLLALLWQQKDWISKIFPLVKTQLFSPEFFMKLGSDRIFWTDLFCSIEDLEIMELIEKHVPFPPVQEAIQFSKTSHFSTIKALFNGNLNMISHDQLDSVFAITDIQFMYLRAAIISENEEVLSSLLKKFPFLLKNLAPEAICHLVSHAVFLENKYIIDYFKTSTTFSKAQLSSYQDILSHVVLSGNRALTQSLFNLFQEKLGNKTYLITKTVIQGSFASGNEKLINLVVKTGQKTKVSKHQSKKKAAKNLEILTGVYYSGFLHIYKKYCKKYDERLFNKNQIKNHPSFFKLSIFKIQYMAALNTGKVNKAIFLKQWFSPTI